MDNARENLCRIRSERNAYRTKAERVGQLDKQVDDLMEERDNLQQAIDDPKHLTDGKEPFEHWLSRMKSKFVVNADHFPTEESKIAYIENRTDGAAARHLEPRMREGHPEKFTTAEEVFKHLQGIYEDPNQLGKAKAEYRRLIMRTVLHLAGEAQVHTDDYKEDFLDKLSFKLQEMVAASCGENTTFKEVQGTCARAAYRLPGPKTRQEGGRNQGNRGGLAEPKREQSLVPAVENNQEWLKNIQCYSCKATGHLARNCHRKKETDVKATELIELEDNSGNDQA
ncbi:hypothetical protein ACJ73_10268 [Blastomyces percursus]|uniref:CCHC-type domain-containing protein n=1 Tax=Blastomyces percursus TaxID=1658174 RepID=A0A1J9PNS5_9EURO|nr:hypothetical protein ACJ73_10268 [Blastomyces percursus]